MQSRLMAAFYDTATRRLERDCLGAWRSELLGEAKGDVLEIGSGTGANLPHYPPHLRSLVLSEPDGAMRRKLRAKLAEQSFAGTIVEDFEARRLGVADASFDCVVSTLVLCSVPSQREALAEIARVLRPGGRLLFIEHVGACDHGGVRRLQRLLEPLWKRLCGNCHLSRKTKEAMEEAGFEFERLSRSRLAVPGAALFPVIRGVARRGV